MHEHRTTLRGTVALLALTAQLSACGASGSATTDRTAAGRGHPDSGIRGRVVIGPTCPVQRIGQPCSRPYQALITVRSQPAGRFIARVRSSATGRFTIAVAPGRYLLVPRSGQPYPRALPTGTTVHEHRYTTVVISYDSGIR